MKIQPKIKFVVWCPPWDPNSGGNICLQKLVHDLVNLGEEAYLLASSKNPNYLGQLYDGRKLDPETTFFIYPEIICGNPYNAKHVIRWLLNGVGIIGGDAGTWADTDLVFRYCEYFAAPDKFKISGDLRTLDAETEFWSQDLGLNKTGKCHLFKKGSNKVRTQHHENSTCLDGYHNKNQIRQVFNSCDEYISYDHASFHSVQAAMAGCLSIVVPDGVNDADDWRQKFPQHKYGIAYGRTESEINCALSTRHLVADHIRSMEAECIDLVREFVKICKYRLG